jgi:hypothetical protein
MSVEITSYSPLTLLHNSQFSAFFQVTMVESRSSSGFFKKEMRIEADPSDFGSVPA